jgi:hypothetical protein
MRDVRMPLRFGILVNPTTRIDTLWANSVSFASTVRQG